MRSPLEALDLRGKKPSWVLLDLDNTLWDFDGNAEEALHVLFHRHRVAEHTGATAADFVQIYNRINHQYWARYEKGEVSKEVLRSARFTDAFLELNYPKEAMPGDIWKEYLDICPRLTRLMPGAQAFLEALAGSFRLAVLTNGFEETQQLKLACCHLAPYFEFVQSSEAVGHAKPGKPFFDLALQRAGAAANDCLYIGDTFRTDVMGGLQSGIPTAWYLRERSYAQAQAEDAAEWQGWEAFADEYRGAFASLPDLQHALLTSI